MTYSSNYKAERYDQIASILTKVTRLEPGGRLRIKGLSPEEQARVRSLLYDWLHHMGVKARFRIRSEAGNLEIMDRRLGSPVSMTVEVPLTSKEEEEMMGELIERYEE